LFRVWNGELAAPVPAIAPDEWQSAAHAARARALALPELAAALQRFARDRATI
jgi:hypothetical protein